MEGLREKAGEFTGSGGRIYLPVANNQRPRARPYPDARFSWSVLRRRVGNPAA